MLVPSLYRLFAGAVSRLSPRSRVRRALLARSVALGYAAANRRDFDVVLVGFDPELEDRPSPELTPPDMEPVFHGYDGYRRLWRHWLDAFEDIQWDAEEMLDFGHALLVSAHQRGRGSGSGIAVSKPVFQLYTLRRGIIVRLEDFLERSQALEAAER